MRSLIMATLGMFVSLIGMENVSGFTRFSLGSLTLSDGLGLVPVAVGMFGIAEVMSNIEEMAEQDVFKTELGSLFPTRQDWMVCRWAIAEGQLSDFCSGSFRVRASWLRRLLPMDWKNVFLNTLKNSDQG